MNDFSISLREQQFEFMNIDKLLDLLEHRQEIPSYEMRVWTDHVHVMNPYGRIEQLRIQNMTISLSNQVPVGLPDIRYTLLFQFQLYSAVAGTQTPKLVLFFKEDKTFGGYNLLHVFRNTTLISMNLEFRIYNAYAIHKPTDRYITIN